MGKSTKTYLGYRALSKKEWCDNSVASRILAVHQKLGGWPLLEEPLLCNLPLCLADGTIPKINRGSIVEVGFNTDKPQQLQGSYVAKTLHGESWLVVLPALDNWSADKWVLETRPCLFVRKA